MSKYKNSQPPQFLLDGTLVVQPPLAESFHKSQHLLGFTIDTLFLGAFVSHVLFVTLTFPTPVRSTKAAQRRLNSFLKKLRRRYGNYLWVLQPHESGSIHFHLLIPVSFDAHDGTDLQAWMDKTLNDAFREKSMNPALKAESDWWHATAPRFGFGRVEVAPIHSNAEAIRLYLTTQDWRDRHWPFIEKKSVRFWGCSGGLRAGVVDFAWYSPGAQIGRRRLREWAHQQGCETYDELPVKLGKKWGYQFILHVTFLRELDRLGIAHPAGVEQPLGQTDRRKDALAAAPPIRETTAGGWSGPQSGGQARPRSEAGVERAATGPTMRPPSGSTVRQYHPAIPSPCDPSSLPS